MSSIIKVNTFQDANGNALFSSDGSGNVTTSASGLQNTPAFHVRLSADQSFSSLTNTKIEFDTEVYDTDNCYDNSTNYRFTPTVAGKYFVYSVVIFNYSLTNNNNINLKLRKNGSDYARVKYIEYNNDSNPIFTSTLFTTVDMNGSTDYLEVFGYADGNGLFFDSGGASVDETSFGAYRIIGA